MPKHCLALTIGLSMVSMGCGESLSDISGRLAKYATFRLTADLSSLTDNQRSMIPILIEAAREMDEIFWWQTYGNGDSLLASIQNPDVRRLVQMNFGPWDRLDEDAPMFQNVGPKSPGANFYPADVSREELTAALEADTDEARALASLYTLVRRGAERTFVSLPYHEAFAEPTERASEKLREASRLADDPGLRRYLELRADALMTDDYRASDMAWMDMKNNTIDIVIGPIETYEDQLFGKKASHEAYVLIKDRAWSERLSRYASLLPQLQRALPVSDAYKQETPGTDSDLNAYDVIFYAGEANTGAKTIAINLPNDEMVQLQKGTRRLQLKNALQAKFDSILVPIAETLIAEDQRDHITFDAFFANVMFHEVAHGLGVKNTITGRGTVREALKEHASAMEEGKADILGLYMVTQLAEDGEWTDSGVRDNYVTFLASIFRSVRFGASDAHGRANMVQLSYLQQAGAFTRDQNSGAYRVDFDIMEQAIAALAEVILTLQGDGDYDAVGQLLRDQGVVPEDLEDDLDRLTAAGIPVDIVFEQGPAVLN